MPKQSARASKKVKSRRAASSRSWKSSKKVKALKRKIKLFLFALIAVGLSTAVLTGLSLYKFMKAPFVQASGGAGASPSWDGKTPFNLALILLADKDQPTSLLSSAFVLHLNPTNQTYGVVNVDIHTQVEMPAGFGKEELSKAYALGNFLQIPQGATFTTQAVERAMAVPINAYLIVDQEGWGALTQSFGTPNPEDLGDYFGWDKLKRIKNFLALTHQIVRTDLELGEIGQLVYHLRQTTSSQTPIWLWEAKDHESLLRQDQRWRNNFSDPGVLGEGRRVLILNGTGKEGLAAFGARWVSNLGAAVLDVGNASHSYPESILISYDPQSYTVRVLAESLGITEVESYLESRHGEELGVERSDITLILGLDKSF